MNQNKRVVITGGIGTGKSLVVKMILDEGYKVIDSDELVHKIYNEKEFINEMTKLFGDSILDEKGHIKKEEIAKIVFDNKDVLKKLESTIYPILNKKINALIKEYILLQDIIFIDMPLYYEKKDEFDYEVDEVWIVYATEEQQISRLVEYRGMEINDAKKRIRLQIPIEIKKEYSKYIINNTEGIENTKKQVLNLIKMGRE